MASGPSGGGDGGAREKQRFSGRNVYTRKVFKGSKKVPNVVNTVATATATAKTDDAVTATTTATTSTITAENTSTTSGATASENVKSNNNRASDEPKSNSNDVLVKPLEALVAVNGNSAQLQVEYGNWTQAQGDSRLGDGNSAQPRGDSRVEDGNKAQPQGDSRVDEEGNKAQPPVDSRVEEERNSVQTQGDSTVEEEGNSVQQQGGLRVEGGNSVHPQGNSTVEEEGNSIHPQGDSTVEEKGNSVQPQGDLRVEGGNTVQPQGDSTVEEEGNTVHLQGDSTVEEEGNSVQQQGDLRVEAGNSIQPQGDSTVEEEGNLAQPQGDLRVEEEENSAQPQGDLRVEEEENSAQPQGDLRVEEEENSAQPQGDSRVEEEKNPAQTPGDSIVEEEKNPAQPQGDLRVQVEENAAPLHGGSRVEEEENSAQPPGDLIVEEQKKSAQPPGDLIVEEQKNSAQPPGDLIAEEQKNSAQPRGDMRLEVEENAALLQEESRVEVDENAAPLQEEARVQVEEKAAQPQEETRVEVEEMEDGNSARPHGDSRMEDGISAGLQGNSGMDDGHLAQSQVELRMEEGNEAQLPLDSELEDGKSAQLHVDSGFKEGNSAQPDGYSAQPLVNSRMDDGNLAQLPVVQVSDDSGRHQQDEHSSLNVQQDDDEPLSPNHRQNAAAVPSTRGLPSGNGAAKSGLEDRVKISLASKSKQQMRELRWKLENELDAVRSLVKRIETKQRQVGRYGNSNVLVGDRIANGGGAKRAHSEVASAGVPREFTRPLHQLSVSMLENRQGVSEIVEKEKRTPKANQFYHNSEFLLAKDKFPPAESNKKSKLNWKKQGAGEVGHLGMGSKFFKSCSSLLEKLMKHKHGWVFNSPVDVEGLGLHDYFSIITHPMDLGTVKSRLNRNWYKSPKEFAEDVRLTFRNAMTYNPKGQDVHVMAEQLSKIFEDRWAIIESDYNREMRYSIDYGSLPAPSPLSRKVPFPPPPLDMRRILDRSESLTRTPKPISITPSSRTPAPKKPKAKDPHKRDMTYEEKQKLSTNLQNLPAEKLDAVVLIIKKKNLAVDQHDDEIEVDIDNVDTETLWELDRFVTNYKKSLSKNKRKAELARERAEALQGAMRQSQTTFTVEVPKETQAVDRNVTPSLPVLGGNQADNGSRSSSSSSSSSDSGSSSSDSDSDSSSASGSDAGSQGT